MVSMVSVGRDADPLESLLALRDGGSAGKVVESWGPTHEAGPGDGL